MVCVLSCTGLRSRNESVSPLIQQANIAKEEQRYTLVFRPCSSLLTYEYSFRSLRLRVTEVFEPMASVLEKLDTAQTLARQIAQLTTPARKNQVSAGVVKDEALTTFTVAFVFARVIHAS